MRSNAVTAVGDQQSRRQRVAVREQRSQAGEVARTAADIVAAIEGVLQGKREVVELAVAVLLAGGHLLLEDVPGVGKTMLAKALARSVDASVRRIQFTPDLLPSDVTGVSVWNAANGDFEFKPGAIFANIVVGDEINRASPKTQSALLECMEEQQVTVDGVSYLLEPPFMVLATQNPVEMEGTYPLPEAQRDRFMARVAVGYPSAEAELAMVDSHGTRDPLADVSPVVDGAQVVALSAIVRNTYISDAVRRYAIDLVSASRETTLLRLGASPRATLHLLRAARAIAAMDGREYVLPDDVQSLAVPVLAHRVLLSAEAQLARRGAASVISDLTERVPVPEPERHRR